MQNLLKQSRFNKKRYKLPQTFKIYFKKKGKFLLIENDIKELERIISDLS